VPVEYYLNPEAVTRIIHQPAVLAAAVRSHDVSRYRLHSGIFQQLRHQFEQCFGLFLDHDLFADASNNQLPSFGFKAVTPSKTLWINGNFAEYGSVCRWLKLQKALAIIIAPQWQSHTWHAWLTQHASHVISLPSSDGLFSNARGQRMPIPPWPIKAYFIDTRFPSRSKSNIIRLKIPSLEDCEKLPPPIPHKFFP